jgi:putative transcriptional regulator
LIIYLIKYAIMTKQRYQGQLLVANPSNPKDELTQAVILVVTHTDAMAVGLQINNPHEDLTVDRVAENSGLDCPDQEPVYYGGNMNQNKIHVVHSLDWQGLSTVALTKDIGITNDISILAAISQGEGPEFYRACSGYWLWENSRLDIQLDPRNTLAHEPHKWETLPATIQNIFKVHPDKQWEHCLNASTRLRVSEFF